MDERDHKYRVTNRYGYATFYECDCGVTRVYEWMPGWPGDYVYFDKKGDKVKDPGDCPIEQLRLFEDDE